MRVWESSEDLAVEFRMDAMVASWDELSVEIDIDDVDVSGGLEELVVVD